MQKPNATFPHANKGSGTGHVMQKAEKRHVAEERKTMRESATTQHRTVRRIVSALATIIAAAMLTIMMPPMQAHAATCSEERNGVYHLLADCTLHIEPGQIATSSTQSPIRQNDSVSSIIIDDPAHTSFLNNDASYMFKWFRYAYSITGLERMDMSHVTSFRSMFERLNPNANVDISSWDMSSATDLSSMFKGVNLYRITGYKTLKLSSRSVDLTSMFERAYVTVSNEDIDVSGWSISPQTTITSMDNMFKNINKSTTGSQKIIIGGDFAKRGAQSNAGMFYGVNFVDIEGLDKLNVSRSKSTAKMFGAAILNNPINISSWDMSSVEDASYMFYGFPSVNDLDLSSWNMSSVKNTSGMFQNSDIDSLKGIGKWDLSHVENASSMYSLIAPTKDMSIPGNMQSVTNASSMFANSDLTHITNIADLRLPNMTSAGHMFNDSVINYLDMSRWGFHAADGTIMYGMIGSPSIRYIKFGDMFKNSTKNLNHELFYNGNGSVWGSLPSYNSPKRWTRLPYNDKDGKFNGTLASLGAGSGWIDQTMWWESPDTAEKADDELKSIINDPGTVIFREVTRPVRFHGNTTGTVTGMPTMTASTWASSIDGDRVPCNAKPTAAGGARILKEWNTEKDGTGTAYQPCDQLDHGENAVDLYAQWKDARKVPVRYHDASGQATGMPQNADLYEGGRYTIPKAAPKRYGYRFKGWATTETGKPAHQPGDTIDIGDAQAIDLYPVWEVAGTSMLPAAGLPAKALIGTMAGTLLLIPLSAAIIGRKRRV